MLYSKGCGGNLYPAKKALFYTTRPLWWNKNSVLLIFSHKNGLFNNIHLSSLRCWCTVYIIYSHPSASWGDDQSQKKWRKPFRGNLSIPRFPRKQTEKERKKNSFRGNRRKRKGKKILSAETDGKGKKKIIASASREETE